MSFGYCVCGNFPGSKLGHLAILRVRKGFRCLETDRCHELPTPIVNIKNKRTGISALHPDICDAVYVKWDDDPGWGTWILTVELEERLLNGPRN